MRGRTAVAVAALLALVLAARSAVARNEADYVEDVAGWPDIQYERITDLAISADGRFVYGAGYRDRAVATFARDTTTGRLTYVEKTDARAMDSAKIVLSPDQRFLYVTSEYYGTITVLPRDPVTGRLTESPTNQVSHTLWQPLALAISPDGANVYAGSAFHPVPDETAYRVNALTAYARDPADGSIAEIGDYLDDRDGNDGLQQPTAILVSPDGAYVYTISRGDRAVGIFARDAVTGLLSFRALTTDGLEALEPYGIPPRAVLSPDGRHLYVTLPDAGRLALFDRDPESGLLALHRLYANDDPLFERLRLADAIAITADGRAVYVFGQGILQLLRDPQSGELASTSSRELDCSPRFDEAVISPDGAFIYASDPAGDPGHLGATATVVTLRINDPLAPPLCAASPRASCVAATSARLDLRADPDPSRRQLRWDWRARGVGSPLGSAARGLFRQALCVYRADDTPSLLLPAEVHVGYGCESRWRARSTSLSYSAVDGRNRPQGLSSIKLTALANGDAKIQVRGEGALLAVPRLELAAQHRIVAQLVTADGRCWESGFDAPLRLDDRRYRAVLR